MAVALENGKSLSEILENLNIGKHENSSKNEDDGNQDTSVSIILHILSNFVSVYMDEFLLFYFLFLGYWWFDWNWYNQQ